MIEGARTLPRPVINPPVKKEEEKTKPLIFKPDETMNEYIDRFVVKYFDKDGLPLESTILLYINYCVNKGNVTMENKQKLTDIGYYLLNIFIPNLPRVDNPDPKEQQITKKTFKHQPKINERSSRKNIGHRFNGAIIKFSMF